MPQKPTLIEHYDTDEEGNDVTYIIVEPDFDPGERQTRDYPGEPASVNFEACYVKGDPQETNIFDDYPAKDSPLFNLYSRIEDTIWQYFEGEQEREASDRAEARYDDLRNKFD